MIFAGLAAKLGIGTALIAVLFGAGYWQGHKRGEERLEAYRAEVTAEAAKQAAETAIENQRRDQITQEASNAWEKNTAALRDYYDGRLRERPARGGAMPGLSRPAAGTPSASADSGFAQRPANCDGWVALLEGDAAQTTLMLRHLQQWACQQQRITSPGAPEQKEWACQQPPL